MYVAASSVLRKHLPFFKDKVNLGDDRLLFVKKDCESIVMPLV